MKYLFLRESIVFSLPYNNLFQQSLKWKDNQVVISKNSVANRLAAMSAATAAIISLTSGDPEAFNYTAVGAGVSTMYVQCVLLISKFV